MTQNKAQNQTHQENTKRAATDPRTLRRITARTVLFGMTLLMLCTVTLGGATIGGVAFAHGAGGPGFLNHGGEPMALITFIRQLELRDDQMHHLENLHQVGDGVRSRRAEHHGEHAARIAAKLKNGETFDPAEARAMVDAHLEQMRETAYSLTDELVAFMNSLDDEQRAKVAAHIGNGAGDGESAGHSRGLRRFFSHLHGHGSADHHGHDLED